MSRNEEIEQELREEIGKKSHTKTLIEILVVLVFLAIIAYTYIFPQQEIQTGLKSENLVFVSSADSEIQAETKSLTGYNWTTFTNAGNSENAKLAAMLLLASEISVIDNQFEFLNETAGISSDEWSKLALERLGVSDTNKAGLLRLINNMKTIQNFYFSKGFSTSEIRASRLDYLYSYFDRYDLPRGEMPLDAQFMVGDSLGMSTEGYEQMLVLMMIRYNLMVYR